MKIPRREFIGATSTLVAGIASRSLVRAQEGGTSSKTPPVPTRQGKVERLFKAPDGHPNRPEARPDGCWIGVRVSGKVFKVDCNRGKVFTEVKTNSHNTSGPA